MNKTSKFCLLMGAGLSHGVCVSCLVKDSVLHRPLSAQKNMVHVQSGPSMELGPLLAAHAHLRQDQWTHQHQGKPIAQAREYAAQCWAEYFDRLSQQQEPSLSLLKRGIPFFKALAPWGSPETMFLFLKSMTAFYGTLTQKIRMLETKMFVNCFAAVGNVFHRRGQLPLARVCYLKAHQLACLGEDSIEMTLTQDILDRILV